MSLQITVAEPARGTATAQEVVDPTPAVARASRQRLRPIALAAIAPICLLLFWEAMVRWTGTRLIRPPAMSRS